MRRSCSAGRNIFNCSRHLLGRRVIDDVLAEDRRHDLVGLRRVSWLVGARNTASCASGPNIATMLGATPPKRRHARPAPRCARRRRSIVERTNSTGDRRPAGPGRGGGRAQARGRSGAAAEDAGSVFWTRQSRFHGGARQERLRRAASRAGRKPCRGDNGASRCRGRRPPRPARDSRRRGSAGAQEGDPALHRGGARARGVDV